MNLLTAREEANDVMEDENYQMKQPVIKFERVHWRVVLIAVIIGVITFFAFHRHAY